ncbi:hypothetical protein [Methylophaga sp.]|uniref:hypothetical protein n=1 Tax=Methylophaga sp. TaxID=2024840 RepID=UPI003A908ADE
MFKMMFFFVSVLLSFSAFAGGEKSTESIGDIEGILNDQKIWAAHELVAEQSYQSQINTPLSLGVFDAKRPLPLKLGITNKEVAGISYCTTYFLDKDFSLNEARSFFEQFAGSKLRLLNVQQVKIMGGGGPIRWCKFTDYKVLASKQEREQASQSKATEDNAYQFEGTIKVLVARLHSSSMIMRQLNAGDITQKSLFERCDKTLTISPPLASHMKGPAYMNKEATVHVKIEGRKCVATSVVFDAK